MKKLLPNTFSPKLFLPLILLMIGFGAYAQPTVLYTALTTTSPSPSNSRFAMTDIGTFRQTRFQSNQSAAVSTTAWAFNSGTTTTPNFNPTWRPITAGNTLLVNSYIPTSAANGAKYNTTGGNDGLLPAITSGNYYTFNVTKNTTADNVMQLLETNFNPVALSSQVFVAPTAANGSGQVSVTVAATPAAAEFVYIRSSNDAFVTSTITPVAFNGTTGVGYVGTCSGNIAYYIFSSNKTQAQLATDVGTYGQQAYDMATLNLLNNAGASFTYIQPTTANFQGNYYVPSVCYPTLASFVTAINVGTVAGAVVCNIQNGYTETAPVGGYSLTATGTAANTITFKKAVATGANPVFTAFSPQTTGGGIMDAVVKIVGSDYITFDGFTLQENAANTTTTSLNNMTEFGFGLFYGTATNGAQNNTIKNCTITLSKTYTNTFGVFSTTQTTSTNGTTSANITNLTGANSNNKIYSNTISNVNTGICFTGTAGFQDDANDIGGTSNATKNVISNQGTSTVAGGYTGLSVGSIAGIHVNNNTNVNISFNTISGGSNVNGYGIFLRASTASSLTHTSNINSNSVTLTSTAGASDAIGINVTMTGMAHTLNINNNTVASCTTAGIFTGTFAGIAANATSMPQINIKDNTISNNNINATTLGTIAATRSSCIRLTSTPVTVNVSRNTMSTNVFNNTGAGDIVALDISGAYTATCTISDNTIDGFTTNGTGSLYGYFNAGSPSGPLTMDKNTFKNVNITGGGSTSTINFVRSNTSSSQVLVFSNNIIDTLTLNTVVTAADVSGIVTTISGNVSVFGNTIKNVSCLSAIYGIRTSSGTAGTHNVYGNTIDNLTSAAGVGTDRYGIDAGPTSGTANIYNNKVTNISTGASTNAVIYGISATSGTTANVFNNIVADLKTPNVTNATSVSIRALTIRTVATAANVYNNSVYLTGTSTGTDFGAAAFSFTSNTVGVDMRNNIFVNNCIPTGTGFSAAIMRTTIGTNGTLATNYAATSNNNCLFAPSVLNGVIYVEGSNTGIAPTNVFPANCFDISAFKTFVSTRESSSFSEIPPFISTTVGSMDLKLNTASPSGCINGGQTIATVANDIDLIARPIGTAYEIGADEAAGTTADKTPPAISYTPLADVGCSTSILMISALITDANTIGSGANAPRLYYKKLSDTNFNIATANNSTVSGWKYVATTTGTSPYSFSLNTSLLPGGLVSGDAIQYFVAAQDVSGNVTSTNATVQTCPSSVVFTAAQVVSAPPTINLFTVRTNLSGIYNIGTAGDYPNLTGVGGLFDAINKGYLSGNITASVISNITENGLVALNEWTEYNSLTCSTTGTTIFRLTIQSDGTVRTISGTDLVYSGTGPILSSLINLNGADRVTFTGGSAAQRLLVFRSTNTINTSCVPVFQIGNANGSNDIVIKNCDIQTNSTSSVVPFGAGILVTGVGTNSNILIELNDIHNALAGTTGNPRFGIYAENNLTTVVEIKNNNIYNIYNKAVFLGTTAIGNGQRITGNSIYYNTGAINSSFSGLEINGGTTTSGHTISGNFIGGTTAGGGTTGNAFTTNAIASSPGFKGISIGPNGITSNTIIENNYIGNINLNNASAIGPGFTGIEFAGKVTCQNNIVGHDTDPAMGIKIGATGLSGNSNIYGVLASNGVATTVSLKSNKIKNISHITSSTSAAKLYGINLSTYQSGSVLDIEKNTIVNLTSNMKSTTGNAFATTAAATAGSNIIGIISQSANGTINILENNINNLSNTGVSTTLTPSIIGIAIDGQTTNNISRNKIYALSNQSPGGAANAASTIGIRLFAGVNTVANNMINLTNGTNTNAARIVGIWDYNVTSTSLNMFYNSIVIGGSQTAGGTSGLCSAPYALVGSTTGNARNLKNNILINNRTGGTSGTTSFHYALAIPTTAPSFLSNYNDLIAADVSKLCFYNTSNYSLADWKALGTPTTPDFNSIIDVPFFVDTTNGDLHLATDSNCALDGKGTNTTTISTDFDNDTRNTTTPDIGADEFNNTSLFTTINQSVTCASQTVNLANAITASNTGAVISYFTDPALTTLYATPSAATPGTYYINHQKGSCSATSTVTVNGLIPSIYNAGVWSVDPPTISNNLIISDNLSVPANTTINGCTCTVLAGKTVNFANGSSLNLLNELVVNTALNTNVVFENNSSLIQKNDAVPNLGNISYKRNAFVKQLDYVYWSAPVAGISANSIYPGTAVANTLTWLTTAANTNGSTGNWQGTAETMAAAKGYAIRVPNTLDPTTPSTITTTFVGVPNNGNYTIGIERGGYTGIDVTSPNGATVTANDDNWNLIGNPYPSAIDALDFLTANNTTIQGSVDVWTHGTTPGTGQAQPFYGTFGSNYNANDYITFNATGPNSGPTGFNGKIAAGQAFFVKMIDGAAATGSVLFSNTMRSIAHDNSQFYKSANSNLDAPKNRIWLDLVNATTNETTRTLVGYVAGATNLTDNLYDATTDYQSNQSFFSLIGQNIYCIQGRALPFANSDTIPMGFAVPSAGTYKIGIHALDGLFANNGQTIYLQDNLTGLVHNLSVSPFTFVATTGANKTRFVLRYTAGALANNNNDLAANNLVIWKDKTTIKAQSVSEFIASIAIFDILGRNVFAQNNINANSFETSNVVSQQQALIVKVTLTNGAIVTKKIIF